MVPTLLLHRSSSSDPRRQESWSPSCVRTHSSFGVSVTHGLAAAMQAAHDY